MAHRLDPNALPTETIRAVLKWNDPNGDFDTFDDGEALTRADLLEIVVDPCGFGCETEAEALELWEDPRVHAIVAELADPIPAGAVPVAIIGRNHMVGDYVTPFGSPYGFAGCGAHFYLYPDDVDGDDAHRFGTDESGHMV